MAKIASPFNMLHYSIQQIIASIEHALTQHSSLLFPLFLFYTIITQFLYGKTFFAVTEVGGKNKPTHSHFYRINPPVFPKGYSKCSLQKLANSSSVTYRGNVEILRPFFLYMGARESRCPQSLLSFIN